MAPKPPMDSREALKPIPYTLDNISVKLQLILRKLKIPANKAKFRVTFPITASNPMNAGCIDTKWGFPF